jgi:hypothetical protein
MMSLRIDWTKDMATANSEVVVCAVAQIGAEMGQQNWDDRLGESPQVVGGEDGLAGVET